MSEHHLPVVKTIESRFVIGRKYSYCINCIGRGIKCRQRDSVCDTTNIPGGPKERVIYVNSKAKLRSKKGIIQCSVLWYETMTPEEMSRQIREEISKRKIISPLFLAEETNNPNI